MADKNSNEEDEKKIPVFTVLKNNSILKNIFLLDNPPSPLEKTEKSNQEIEQILTLGRHPDCTIMLTHPSISRFHLRILSNPSSQKLSVVDLSSVHGTWVSDRKIEPGVKVELKDGDTVRIGGSSRVYKLYWVPMSKAYDLDNLFLSSSDLSMMEEKEEELMDLDIDENCEDDDSISAENKEFELIDSISEVVESLFLNEHLDYFVKKEVLSAPPMPDEFSDVECFLNQSLLKYDHEQNENLNPIFEPNATFAVNFSSPFEEFMLGNEAEAQPLVVAQSFSEIENLDIAPKVYEFKSNFEDELDSLSLDEPEVNSPVTEVLEGFLFDGQTTTFENEAEAQPLVVEQLLSEIKNPETPPKSSEFKSIYLDGLNSLSLAEPEVNPPMVEVLEQVENQTPVKSEYKYDNWSGTLETKTMNLSLPSSSIPMVIENERFEAENQTTASLHATTDLGTENSEIPLIRSEPKLNFSSIWSRRGKPASAIQIQTGRVKEPKADSKNGEGDENNTIAKTLCFGSDRDENATCTPDKENLTPNNLPLLPKKKKGKAEEKKQLMFYNPSPSKVAASPSSGGEDMFGYSDKENQTPKVLQERTSARSSSTNRARLTSMKRGAERVPFQSVILNSDAKSKSEASVLNTSAKSSASVNRGKSIEKRTNLSSINNAAQNRKRWYMVVDTASLLNKESRKALQLLQGLKGTQLIIPKTVLRELNCLKQRASMFRRMSGVSSVLQWIEECMVSTDWWIHVQRSNEEGLPIAPTPLAFPESSSTTNSEPFSPAAEDHILEIALLYRRLKNDGQLVLLSTDVTLKIKAMAEGVICETAEEFRESLVNPFCDRFLWAESSPRGLTWSCEDDVVLRENYYSCPFKKATKGGGCVKGLKLILLHNSDYSKTSSYF